MIVNSCIDITQASQPKVYGKLFGIKYKCMYYILNKDNASSQPLPKYLASLVVHGFGQRSHASLIPPVLVGCIKRRV